jgi:hypothetical protein
MIIIFIFYSDLYLFSSLNKLIPSSPVLARTNIKALIINNQYIIYQNF